MSANENYSVLYDIKNVFKLILTTLSNDLKADIVSIMMADEFKQQLTIIESLGLSMDSILNISFSFNDGIAGRAFSEKKYILVNNVSESEYFKNFNFQRESIGSIISYPIIDDNSVIAVLNISSSKTNNFSEKTLAYLDNYATLIMNAIRNYKASNEELPLNFIDENTGLYNYSFFLENLRRENDRAERYSEVYSLILIRITNFNDFLKKWDDSKVKEALRYFGSFIKNTSRRVDICAAYDINTFAVITPETGKGGAQKKVERLYFNVANMKYYPSEISGLPQLDAMCGISSYPSDGKNINEILNHCLSQI